MFTLSNSVSSLTSTRWGSWGIAEGAAIFGPGDTCSSIANFSPSTRRAVRGKGLLSATGIEGGYGLRPRSWRVFHVASHGASPGLSHGASHAGASHAGGCLISPAYDVPEVAIIVGPGDGPHRR